MFYFYNLENIQPGMDSGTYEFRGTTGWNESSGPAICMLERHCNFILYEDIMTNHAFFDKIIKMFTNDDKHTSINLYYGCFTPT